MPARHPSDPSPGELEILQVLWQRGPSTVRQIHEALRGRGAAGYTTTLKFLQIMHEKGLVQRDESQRSHIYRSAVKQERLQRRLVQSLLDRAFEGSPARLVMQALSAKRASSEELRQIRALLDELEKGDNP